MPRRSFDDSYWGDPFVQELNKDAKLLFAYLWTNKRCNSAGLYEITLRTIAFETGIETETLPSLLNQLSKKVNWVESDNLIWVRNFLKHQPKSPQFLKSVADCLSHISSNGVVKEYIDYYDRLGVSIPYTNQVDKVRGEYGDTQELELEPALELELDNKGKSQKHKYGELKNVLLFDKEKDSLIGRFGKDGFTERVEEMSLAIGSKGYQYKSHYLAIIQWEKRKQGNGTHKADTRGNKGQPNNDKKYITGEYGSRFVEH